MGQSADLLPGTLDMLILKAVSLGRLHGYGVLLRIEQISGGALQIQVARQFSNPRLVVVPLGSGMPRLGLL